MGTEKDKITKYKMDLHIHTPASKCYKDPNTDDTYIDILKKTVNEGIKIIAITDHNTIAGYKHFFAIKDNLINEKRVLEKYAKDNNDIKNRIKGIDEILDLYSKVWIIPGVELTLNPGVHLIVLAEKDRINELSNLLDCVGYSDECGGYDSDYVPDMDIKQFLKSPLLAGKIVYAPHVDSSKGIFEELSGNYRAEIFRSEVINAVSVNNIGQLTKIQALISNEPLYRRNKMWAYINASDAHSVKEIGSKTSFVELEEKSFEGLIHALDFSAEYISDVEHQEITDFINLLRKKQKTILINQKECEDCLDKYVSAAFNSGFYSIIVGVDYSGKIIGTNIEKESMRRLIEESLKKNSYKRSAEIRTISEMLGNGRQVHILLLDCQKTGISYLEDGDEAYVFDTSLKKASINDIKEIIGNQILRDMELFQEKNDETIIDVCNNLSTTKKPVERFKAFSRIREKTYPLSHLANVISIKGGNSPSIWEDVVLGNSYGEILFAKNEKTVLDYAILRFSCPRVGTMFDQSIVSNMVKFEDTCLVITERGGTYLAEKEDGINYLDSDSRYLKIELKKEEISPYSLVLWMKSTILLWYVNRVSGNIQLYLPQTFKNIVIPPKDIMMKGGEIERLSKEIIAIEKDFIKYADSITDKIDKNPEKEEELMGEFSSRTNNHNLQVLEKYKEAEKILCVKMGISEEQLSMMMEDLQAASLWPKEV